jgi:hypothetical protein
MDFHCLPIELALHRRLRLRFCWRWLVIPFFGFCLWGWFDVRERGFIYPEDPQQHKTDFTVYTEAGAAFFDGRAPYEVANPRGWTYVYPPLFALILAPLHVLPAQDQVMLWFVISLLLCWGCIYECGHTLQFIRAEDEYVARRYSAWFPWLGLAAVFTAALPTLNCLQRGQVGILKLYLLVLGLRLVISGGTRWVRFLGGMTLALPIALKIIPVLPVSFLIFVQFVMWIKNRFAGLSPLTHIFHQQTLTRSASKGAPTRYPRLRFGLVLNTLCRASPFGEKYGLTQRQGVPLPAGKQCQIAGTQKHCLQASSGTLNGKYPSGEKCGLASTSLGLVLGLVFFFLIIPSMLIGWKANLRHLDTFSRFVLTKADDGGEDPRSGNSRSTRNQSLHNAAYRLGNYIHYAAAGGPNDKLADFFERPKTIFERPTMIMDSPAADKILFGLRLAILAALGLAGIRLGLRGDALSIATAFGLGCAALLVVSPVSRGHYFMLLVPAILCLPLWLDRENRTLAAILFAVVPIALVDLHYIFLAQAGRVGLLGLGTTVWLVVALILVLLTKANAKSQSAPESLPMAQPPIIFNKAA